MKRAKQLFGLLLIVSPFGTIASVVGRLHGIEPMLANAIGLIFGVCVLAGIVLLSGRVKK